MWWGTLIVLALILVFIVLPVWAETSTFKELQKKAESGKAKLSLHSKSEKKKDEFEGLLYLEDRPFLELKTGNYPNGGTCRITKDYTRVPSDLLFIKEDLSYKRLEAPSELVVINRDRIRKIIFYRGNIYIVPILFGHDFSLPL